MAYEELCPNSSFIIVLLLFFIDLCRKTTTFACPPKGLNLLLLLIIYPFTGLVSLVLNHKFQLMFVIWSSVQFL